MGKFVDKQRVAISDDSGNTIYIRAKMDVGTRAQVQGAALPVSIKPGKKAESVEVDFGAYQLALLQCNILDWEGPDFTDTRGRPIPCTPEAISELDPEDELVSRAIAEIAARNLGKESPDPKLRVIASGSMNAGEDDSKAA